MSDELKSIISKIAFPVRYDDSLGYIFDSNTRTIATPEAWKICTGIADDKDSAFLLMDAFGHELARLINTLDPKRESVSDKEITNESTKVRLHELFSKANDIAQINFINGAKWMRDKLSGK